MWAGILHLLFGNTLIGIGEGLLLARLFELPKAKSILVMIPANYFSAWLGMFVISEWIVPMLPMDLNNGLRWLWSMVFLAYCMTLASEWPFIAWCFRGRKNWLGRSVLASFAVQSASYVLLFGWYWLPSGASLFTNTTIVAAAELPLPNSVTVYYIDPDDGNAYSRPLTGGTAQKVYDLGSTSRGDVLFLRRNPSDSNRWDLAARLETGDYKNPRFEVIKTNLSIEAAPRFQIYSADPRQSEERWFNFGEAPELGAHQESPWKFQVNFWAGEGLLTINKKTGERFHFAYETPFVSWRVRNAVHLPSDIALFQLGDEQICAFDPVTKRLALLWHGQAPMPVIENTDVADEGNAKPTASDK
ncbi:MAG: hypothetical protein HZB26_19210 [Candidatus Hydrogenedentes bacterium]|nr:hypothetical protein [Candidatus Hydrogenedentota bacterium]